MKIQHVVFSHYHHLRWYFISTEAKGLFFLSTNPLDIKYLFKGINILLPPLTTNHIKGYWD